MKILVSNSCKEEINSGLSLTVKRTVQKPPKLASANTSKEIASHADKARSNLVSNNSSFKEGAKNSQCKDCDKVDAKQLDANRFLTQMNQQKSTHQSTEGSVEADENAA